MMQMQIKEFWAIIDKDKKYFIPIAKIKIVGAGIKIDTPFDVCAIFVQKQEAERVLKLAENYNSKKKISQKLKVIPIKITI